MYEIINKQFPKAKYDELRKALSGLKIGQALVVNTNEERKTALMYGKRSGLGHRYTSIARLDGKFEIYRYE